MRHLLRFLAVSMCAGIVAAGLAIPVAGTTAAALGEGMSLFDAMPAEFDDRPLAQPSTLLTKDGKEFATFSWQNRDEVALDQVSQAMQDATLAIEDRRFYEHGPVDVEGVARAVAKNLLTGSLHGGSTLTQQYVKNALINSSQAEGDTAGIDRARDRTGASGMARKLREMRLAITVEQTYSKDEILSRYLNINSYSGSPNVYGVQAAARQYWDIDAADLSIAQAATLAGIVRNPARYNPQRNPDAVIERRNLVLEKMAEYGFITSDELAKAKEEGLNLKENVEPRGCSAAGDLAYFCTYVESAVLSDERFGATPEEREETLRRGGLTIRTSIDSKLQKKAVETVRRQLPVGDRSGAAQALVSVDVATGEIRAMTQNTKYSLGEEKQRGKTSVNYSVDAPAGGGTGFQPGSTWKPFVLAAWLEDGRSLGDTVNGSGSGYTGFSTSGCDGRNYASAGYNPRNAGDSDGANGGMTVLEATKRSVNKAYADMASQLNMCDIRDTATNLGVHLGTGKTLSTATLADGTEQVLYPSSILGTVSVSPLTMASAYTAFANSGRRCAPEAIVTVTGDDGTEITGSGGASGAGESAGASAGSSAGSAGGSSEGKGCAEVIDPTIADTVAYALSQTFEGGTTTRLRIGEPAAAKTGTTNFEVGASWLVGFTKGLSTAVWTGDPEGMRDWRTNSRGSMPRIVYGETVSGPTWREFMNYAAPRAKTGSFPRPAGAGGSGSGTDSGGGSAGRSGRDRSDGAGGSGGDRSGNSGNSGAGDSGDSSRRGRDAGSGGDTAGSGRGTADSGDESEAGLGGN